jgi:hypothetical protein
VKVRLSFDRPRHWVGGPSDTPSKTRGALVVNEPWADKTSTAVGKFLVLRNRKSLVWKSVTMEVGPEEIGGNDFVRTSSISDRSCG